MRTAAGSQPAGRQVLLSFRLYTNVARRNARARDRSNSLRNCSEKVLAGIEASFRLATTSWTKVNDSADELRNRELSTKFSGPPSPRVRDEHGIVRRSRRSS